MSVEDILKSLPNTEVGFCSGCKPMILSREESDDSKESEDTQRDADPPPPPPPQKKKNYNGK